MQHHPIPTKELLDGRLLINCFASEFRLVFVMLKVTAKITPADQRQVDCSEDEAICYQSEDRLISRYQQPTYLSTERIGTRSETN